MKALRFCLIFLLPFHLASGQSCTPDPSIVDGDEVMLPRFWTPADLQFNLAVACINESYAQTLTIYPPAILVVPNVGEFPLNSMSVSTTGAVINLPEGMSYSCNPPNCVFPSEELGCIQLEGVPSADNDAPDTVALSILSVLDVGIPLVATLPDDIESGSLIPLIVLPQGQCISAVHERKKNLVDLKVFPNPFHSETTISLLCRWQVNMTSVCLMPRDDSAIQKRSDCSKAKTTFRLLPTTCMKVST